MQRDSFLSLAPSGFHRVAYLEWGNPASDHVVICVHGLARNSRDFDALARDLSDRCRVICMDVAGRGDSEWLAHKADYRFSTYMADAAALIARVTTPATRIDWVGTSMGGLIGMLLAAKAGSPIQRLVLNDVGPFIPWSALYRLKGYVGARSTFHSVGQAELHLRDVCAQFGPLTDEQWRQLAEHSVEATPQGEFRLRYDPGIGAGMRGHADPEFPLGPNILAGIDLWTTWRETSCPTLVLRGAQSDVLSQETARQMLAQRPSVELVELPGIGHAPALMSYDQIAAVRAFLLR
jgi:pimeloyl-ACP methyl ester carboxylesterase